MAIVRDFLPLCIVSASLVNLTTHPTDDGPRACTCWFQTVIPVEPCWSVSSTYLLSGDVVLAGYATMSTASNENLSPGAMGAVVKSQVTFDGCKPDMNRARLPAGDAGAAFASGESIT